MGAGRQGQLGRISWRTLSFQAGVVQNSLGTFEQFRFGSRRNGQRLRRFEDRHLIPANRGQHEFDTPRRIQVHRPYV